MEKGAKPFEFKECVIVPKSTGKKARNLRELRALLGRVSDESISHHTYQYFLSGHVLGGREMKKVVFSMVVFSFALALLWACASTTGRTAGAMVDDTTIANTIRAKIVEDKELSILKINTDVFNGDVTLLGVVPTKHAEDRLLEIAHSVKGVRSVTSKLTIQQK